MPTIKTYTDTVLGDIKISFSTLHNRFVVDTKIAKGFSTSEKLNDWESVERYIKELRLFTIHDNRFIRRIIVLDLKTTEPVNKETERAGIIINNDQMSAGVGFKMNWYVCDEFSTYYQSEDYKNNPNNIPKMGKNLNMYTIIEGHDGSKTGGVGKIDILGQLFHGDGVVLEYSDELYNFLIDTELKLKDIIKQIALFINPDPKILMENITQQLKLGN